MKEKKLWLRYLFTVTILMVMLLPLPVLAADAEWRMMHGEQDALIIGTVREVTGEGVLVQAEHVILCKEDSTLNRQLPGEEIPEEMEIESVTYDSSYHGRTTPETGDFIVISADRSESKWKQCWLALEVSSTDLTTLETLPKEEMTAKAYAWQLFLRSDGEMNEFSYEGMDLYVNENDESKQVFSWEEYQEDLKKEGGGEMEKHVLEEVPPVPDTENKAVSFSIIGGADGPTSIFLAGKIGNGVKYIAITIGAIIVAAILGAVLIYKKRKKRPEDKK